MSMRVLVIEPPAAVVSYEEAVARLRLDGGEDERADVEAMIAAATGHIDGPDGWLGRSLGPQVLEARLDAFCGSIFLPYQPVIEVQSIQYRDGGGTLQTLDASIYEALGREVVTAWQKSWPATASARESVRVRYRAGYVRDDGNGGEEVAVPEAIRTAILLMVGDLYQNRETTTANLSSASISMSMTVENILAPFRCWR